MANREACELYIEQEIKSALEEGKKPWTIGKELAAWVEKLFEVTINPYTLTTRAKRIKNKNGSNEPEKSKHIETIEYSKPEIIENRKPQGGGAREGAGRPLKKDYIHTEVHVVSYAIRFADMAISQLERIEDDDPERGAAFDKVMFWIENKKAKGGQKDETGNRK